MSKKEKKMNNILTDDTILDIPEDEIYTYKIEGLAAPHINKPYSHYRLKKAVFIIVIVISVSLSMFFSLYILATDTFTFAEISDGNYQFTKFSNPGYIEELTINYALDIVYPEDGSENDIDIKLTDAPDALPATPLKTKEEFIEYQKYLLKEEQLAAIENAKKFPRFQITEDKSKPVTSIKEYAINGDGYIKTVYIGENVLEIDGKAFYSCWALKNIEVDENNPNYCDIDGVLYTKDKKTVVCYPCDHDQYLREKYGYPKELWADPPRDTSNKEIISAEDYAPIFEEYKTKVMTYVIPSTVETVGELCFNYSNLKTVYLPEGLKKIDNLGFFEMPNMSDFYTYVTESAVTDTSYEAAEGLETYLSFPEGLQYIGTDAFSYNKAMTYAYIPSSVTYIGHHAFWDTVYKEGGELKGLYEINVALDKDTFKKTVETGDQWVPIYDSNLLRKIPVNYEAERK
ncbi:MAG: leucine-rich repeat protein [Clostridia bacterium]|nr:leucine-rich repeat protein [Clostridia bacterium]